jgi:hypothetical protein
MRCKPRCEFRFVDEEHGPICGHCDDRISNLIHCPRGIVRTLDDHKVFKKVKKHPHLDELRKSDAKINPKTWGKMK